MFPSNLHKNIVQLDRQISLLENEYKNMEGERKKKYEQPQNKCSRVSNLPLKSSLVKSTLKKSVHNGSKRSKKIMPPFSARVPSGSSLSQSNNSKPCSEIYASTVGRKVKQQTVNTQNTFVRSCRKEENAKLQNNPKKVNACGKCICCDEESSGDFSKKTAHSEIDSNFNENKMDQILHKEVIFSNPEGIIEVTVTQKPKSDDGKENIPFKKNNYLVSTPEKDVGNCNCQQKGRKWSEILSLDEVKRRESTKTFSGIIPDGNHSHTCSLNRAVSEDTVTKSNNNENRNAKGDNYEIPIKLSQTQTHKILKPIGLNRNKIEKETQCYLDTNEFKEPLVPTGNSDTLKIFQFLINELEQKPNEEKTKLLRDMESALKKLSHNKPSNLYMKAFEENKKDLVFDPIISRNDVQYLLKQHCENIIKEKDLLSKELSAKESVIQVMQKREEEYLLLISNLKSNLEKAKESAQDGVQAVKELSTIKRKFLEQTKMSEALKKSYSRMQDVLERCALENDKLKTQIQIYKLESQKHDILLAGKEAEIKRYKEEIRNFQMQISDHLAALKSNAQEIDVEKMVEAIIQRSQIFACKDFESVASEKDENESSSKQNNVLMHSSPTSTKNSVVNSSWRRISSIREQDQTKCTSDIFTNLNDSQEKEFYEIFGEDSSSSESRTPKKSRGTVVEKPINKPGLKRSSSFTSCLSAHDCDPSSAPKGNAVPIKPIAGTSKKFPPSEKVQNNIEELLQNMKLKWSKEVRGKSSDNCTIDDFLNSSQISSITMASGDVQFVKTPSKKNDI